MKKLFKLLILLMSVALIATYTYSQGKSEIGRAPKNNVRPQLVQNLLQYLPSKIIDSGSNSGQKDSFCAPTYLYGCAEGDGFTDFAVEEIQNLGSGCENTGGMGWSEYYSLGPANFETLGTYTFTMSTGYSNQFVNIWIDFNDDLVLTVDELILEGFVLSIAGVLFDVEVTIPADAIPGQHAMRAMTVWNTSFNDPCGSYNYGEAEDYYVIIAAPDFGTLNGFVTENTGGAPVEGATINIANGGYITTTAADGFYEIQNVVAGTWEVTCTKEGYNIAVVPVVIVQDNTTTQDFQLTQPQVELSTESVTVIIAPDNTFDEFVTISNTGDGNVDWSAQIQFLDDNTSNSDFPKGFTAWAYDATNDQFVNFDTDLPGTFNQIAATPGWSSWAADFDNINTTFYYIINDATGELQTVDVATGAILNTIGTPSFSVDFVTGMACDKTSGIMYVSAVEPNSMSYSSIWTLDLTTAVATLVGQTTPGEAIIDIAIDGSGSMYGYGIVNNEGLSIDKATGAATVLGPLGFDANYGQDMAYDPQGDVIYLCAYNNDGTGGQLRIFDPVTGGSTLVGGFPGGAQTDAFAFPGGVSSWLSINPHNGVIEAGDNELMTLHFDALGLIPGTYEAEIHFNTNPNVGSPVVNVTMTVTGLIPAINLTLEYNCTDVELTWDMPAGGTPDSWNVYKSGVLLGNSTAMGYTDEMVMPEVELNYFVKAVYSGEESIPTVTQYITVPIPLNLPALGLEAVSDIPNENDVTLTWDAPTACVAPDGYDVYRDGTQINTSLITTLSYVDFDLPLGLYEYYIVAVYYFGESTPSDPVTTLITGIENPDSDIFRIYPNPTSAVINIESAYEISGIQVYNNAGQLVIDKLVKANQYQINVSQFEKGIYYIKIETVEGNKLRKIAVN